MSARNDAMKLHWWMGAIEVTYERVDVEGEDPKPKKATMNVLFHNNKKLITNALLIRMKQAVVQRVNNELHIAPEMLRNIVIQSTSYLGLMTEKEFNEPPEEEAEEKPKRGPKLVQ